jgi:DNA-binding CsgD family transcriptional regulator
LSRDIAVALNDRHSTVVQKFNLGLAEYLGGSKVAAEALFRESLDLARRVGMRRSTVYALIGLALADDGQAGPAWSARMHGAADQALSDMRHVLEPLEARLAELDRQQLRASMGAAAFEAEYAAGRALGLAGVLAGLRPRDAARQPRAAESSRAASVLTPRELDVLKLVAQGLSNPDIARRLVLSEHTVHRHVANIFRKLSLSSRAAATAWAVRTGL